VVVAHWLGFEQFVVLACSSRARVQTASTVMERRLRLHPRAIGV